MRQRARLATDGGDRLYILSIPGKTSTIATATHSVVIALGILMIEGLTPAQKQQVQQSFNNSLNRARPSVSYTPSDARRGESFFTFGVGRSKAIVGISPGRRLRSETGSFL